ncbi:hypothetical protein ACIRNI_29730 [Streptomyces sp. NPDC093546]|uniref:hypothetical protein n=1 Tax=Streptomyces sp. NPDC093546 TaxID=3366040 RepID=UPI00380492F4
MSVQAGGPRSAATGGNVNGAVVTGNNNVTHLHPPPTARTVVAVLVTLAVIGGLIVWYAGSDDPDMPPLAATTEFTPSKDNCEGWTFPGKRPEDIPIPPGEPTAEWAHQLGGIDNSITRLRLVIQGMNNHDVVLRNMRIVEVRRGPLPAGTDVSLRTGCGGDLLARNYRVMLAGDAPDFELVTRADDGKLEVIKKPFGYKVSATDPEIFDIEANAAGEDYRQCDCLVTWKLALDWTHKGKQGTLIVDNKGAPFRTKSTDLNSRYPVVVKHGSAWK